MSFLQNEGFIMIVNVGWNSFKSIKDQSGNTIFYSVENEYYSNDPNVNNIQRYFNYKTSKKNNEFQNSFNEAYKFYFY